jgi:hypothetical protein
MRLQTLSFLALFAPLVACQGVEFTTPAAGASIPAGSLKVAWQNEGTSPEISDLSSYTLQLMVGGNDDDDMVGYPSD